MKRLRSLTGILILAAFASRLGQADTPTSVLPSVDSKDTFPHLVWISSKGRDSEYPAGFRYKLLSVRSADSKTVEFALIRELSNGDKIIALHARGPLPSFTDTATELVEDFSRRLDISFQKFDLSDVQTFEEFQARAKELDWEWEG